MIGPFQNHDFAAVIGQPMDLPAGVDALEVGRRFTDARRGARPAGIQGKDNEGHLE
jgi:hypothetical protein